MEVLRIQLFGLCKSEFINNGNFLQCREINHGADGMTGCDQEIKVENTWTCFYSLQTQLLRAGKGTSSSSLLNAAGWGGKLQWLCNHSSRARRTNPESTVQGQGLCLCSGNCVIPPELPIDAILRQAGFLVVDDTGRGRKKGQ